MRAVFIVFILFSLGGCTETLDTPPLLTSQNPPPHDRQGEGDQTAANRQHVATAAPVVEQIIHSFPDGSHYEGEAQQGEPHGQGTLTWPDGARYTGTFQAGQRTGYGLFTWPSGNYFEGEFKQGQRDGQGTFTWTNGARYVGAYRQGKRHGTGVFHHANKRVEVCYKIPEQQRQLWKDGLLTASHKPLPDEPPPNIAYEAKMHPPLSPFQGNMSRRLSKTPTKAEVPHSTQHTKTPRKTQRWQHKQTGLSFALVPGGCFQMGSNQHASNEQPQHPVCVDEFWIGRYEITQKVWQQQMGELPEQSQQGAKLPVENVSWNDVQHFIETLNQRSESQFRLPSEAEWEYACRSAGLETPYCGGYHVSALAWHKKNSSQHVHPVGKRQANSLGLHDMSGNVWEWVADWYDANYYKRSPKSNPTGPMTGRTKVFRGGSWLSAPKFLRSTLRYDLAPDRGYNLLGLRLVAMPR